MNQTLTIHPLHTVTVTRGPAPAELAEWDQLVRSVPSSDVAQLSGWGRLRERAGYVPIHVFVRHDGRLVAGAQVLERRLRPLGGVGYLPYGPLVAPGADGPAEVRAVLADALARLARDAFRLLIVQPSDGDEATRQALLDRGFRPSASDIGPSVSVHVDLTLSEEEIRRRLSRRLRDRTRTWSNNGVTVRRADEEDLPVVARLLACTAEFQDFTPYGLDYLATMYRELAPTGNLVIFIGEHRGTPVAMTVFTGCGGVLKNRLIGFDRSDAAASHLSVPAAVHWTAMQWARTNGYRWFDLGGVLPQSAAAVMADGPVDTSALAGPDRFKVRLGGTGYRYPAPVELIPSPVLRTGYDLVRRSRAGRAAVERVQRSARASSATTPSDQESGVTTQKWAIPSNPLFDRVVRPAFVRARLAVRLAMFDRRLNVDTENR